MRGKQTTIEIEKEYLHFAAAHFTIFSATERENLHGHNFYVTAHIDTLIGNDGLAFDYNHAKRALKQRCDELDEVTLLPESSPHLDIEHDGGCVVARFGDERLQFLARDVRVLDVANVTVEALAEWFLNRLTEDLARNADVDTAALLGIRIGVSSGPGQWARTQVRFDDAGNALA